MHRRRKARLAGGRMGRLGTSADTTGRQLRESARHQRGIRGLAGGGNTDCQLGTSASAYGRRLQLRSAARHQRMTANGRRLQQRACS